MNFNFFKKKQTETDKAPVILSEVSIKYSYEWKENVPDNEKDTPGFESRLFCRKLIQLTRLYTRDQIQQISMKVGYDVYNHCGGFEHTDEETGEFTPQCRHRWVSRICIKKF